MSRGPDRTGKGWCRPAEVAGRSADAGGAGPDIESDGSWTASPRRPTYAAFLSYSRAVDGQLAPRLQQALQRFAKPWYRRRAVRVFRDDANLSANPGLWSSIQAALDGSEYFILLASPRVGRLAVGGAGGRVLAEPALARRRCSSR